MPTVMEADTLAVQIFQTVPHSFVWHTRPLLSILLDSAGR